MAQRKDFVPARDAEFDEFFGQYRTYVNAKRSPPDTPEWSRIPSPRLADLNDAYADWHAAYIKLAEPHTSSDVPAKDLARGRDEKALRVFNNEFILYIHGGNIRPAPGIGSDDPRSDYGAKN
jgi:hypothetical protein